MTSLQVAGLIALYFCIGAIVVGILYEANPDSDDGLIMLAPIWPIAVCGLLAIGLFDFGRWIARQWLKTKW